MITGDPARSPRPVALHVLDVASLDLHRLRELEGFLSSEERARGASFHSEEDRTMFAAAHGFVRATLGACVGVDPTHLVFDRGEHGKPFVASPDGARALAYNLSHTRRFAALIVTTELDVGVDVERIDPDLEVGTLARRFFAPEEVAELEPLTGERLRRRFFTLWTLKEAYLKARGVGIAHGLDTFAFHLDEEDRPIDLRLAGRGGLEEHGWQFGRATIAAHHVVAWAIGSARHVDVDLAHFGPGNGVSWPS